MCDHLVSESFENMIFSVAGTREGEARRVEGTGLPDPWEGACWGPLPHFRSDGGGGAVDTVPVYSFVKMKTQDQASPPLPPCGLSPVFQTEMVNSFGIFVHVCVYSCLDYKNSRLGGRAGVEGVGLQDSPCLHPA